MRILLSRIADIVLRQSRERRLSTEIEHHMRMLVDELRAQGWSEPDAQLEARRQFGNVDQVRLAHREQRGLPVVERLIQDMRFAGRVLIRDHGFAATAIVVLGVGLGVNNLFFTLVYTHKFRGIPIARADRVLSVSTIDDRGANRALSLPEFHELRQGTASFAGVGAYVGGVATVGDRDRSPERLEAAYVSSGTFELLGIAPSLGRLPSPGDDRRGNAAVVLLGADAWRRRYAGDPRILGRTILINASPATVIGIIRERSGFPSNASVWMPLGQWPDWKEERGARALSVLARVRDGVATASARSEIETLFGRFEAAYPETSRNIRARVVTINERILGTLEGWWPFIIAGAIVILVACANVANLMMARALSRAPEIAIRTSLGASRGRLVFQLMVEAALIAGGGAVVGALVSVAGARAIDAGIPDGVLPYWLEYTMDRSVLAGLVGVALLTVMVFGLVPALHASRTNVNHTLKTAGQDATTATGMRLWTTGFLTVQLALAMILLAQVAVASYIANQEIPTDANVNTTEIVTGSITLPAVSYPTAERRREFFARLEDRLRSRTEIVQVSLGTVLPGEGGPLRRLHVRGRETAPDAAAPTVLAAEAAPGYFETLAIGVLRGRDFTAADGLTGSPVAIVNERFAELFLDGADPMAGQVALSPATQPPPAQPQWLTIVGVVPTIRHLSAGDKSPVIYLPIAASAPATVSLMVRHRVEPETAAEVLRAETTAVDSSIAIYRARTLKQAARDAQWVGHTSAVLADTVVYMSVLLAVVGLYAVTAQRVTLKTREIGVRMALGARSLQIGAVIIRSLSLPLVLGLLLGTAGAMAWDGAFSSGVAGIYASAPATLLMIAGFLLVFVVAACAIPLRRAIATNPNTALRHY